jgi:hypothetical protein
VKSERRGWRGDWRVTGRRERKEQERRIKDGNLEKGNDKAVKSREITNWMMVRGATRKFPEGLKKKC